MIVISNAMLMMLLNRISLAEGMSISTLISIPSNVTAFVKIFPHHAQEYRASSAHPKAMRTTP